MLKKPTQLAVRTLTASLAVFALLGMKATEAHASNTTEFDIDNNTPATLTVVSTSTSLSGGTNWYAMPAGTRCVNGEAWTLGPPATIAPYTHACFGAQDNTIFQGTGGSFQYTVVPDDSEVIQSTAGNATALVANAAKDAYTYATTFTWSSPSENGNVVGGAAGHSVTTCAPGPVGTTACTTGAGGTAVAPFSVVTPSNNTSFAQYELDATPLPAPQARFWQQTVSGGLSGSAGTGVQLSGADLVTGALHVMFGPNAASTVICANETFCTALAPAGTGIVPVTVSVYGLTAAVGNFSYLATPGCTFSGVEGELYATCTEPPSNDPIWVFAVNGAGAWDYLDNYTVASGTQAPIATVTAATSYTVVGCVETEDGQLNSKPGAPGCDNFPTTLTVPPPRPFPVKPPPPHCTDIRHCVVPG